MKKNNFRVLLAKTAKKVSSDAYKATKRNFKDYTTSLYYKRKAT